MKDLRTHESIINKTNIEGHFTLTTWFWLESDNEYLIIKMINNNLYPKCSMSNNKNVEVFTSWNVTEFVLLNYFDVAMK